MKLTERMAQNPVVTGVMGPMDSMPRLAGVKIPLPALRSAGTEGIGDFLALGDMAVWAGSVGMKVVQTLPLNDTLDQGELTDTNPYSAISALALNPLYIRVEAMDPTIPTRPLRALERHARIDYQAVVGHKWEAFMQSFRHQGERVIQSPEYQEFYADNRDWLEPYALFCHLRDTHGTADFRHWPQEARTYTQSLFENHAQGMTIHLYLQFFAHQQLLKARTVAHQHGVLLKGDLAIGISPNSVDMWQHPQLFNPGVSAGAPPDDFSTSGQNWHTPTYNWPQMAMTDYHWWHRRLQLMAQYFDMYRLDHILGYFRIWEIDQAHNQPLLGIFRPSLPLSPAEMLDNFGFRLDPTIHMGTSPTDLNTLFVEDPAAVGMYHPRIAAHFTLRYRSLPADVQQAFSDLYNHYYYHRHTDFWAGQALCKLPHLLDSTNMVPCAEDLGMLPDCVGWVLGQLGVATLELERLPKDPHQIVGDSAQNPYPSVATTTTHDMAPMRVWWAENRAQVQQYYNKTLVQHGPAPLELNPTVAEVIISHLMSSPSMAVIVPLSDLLSLSPNLRHPMPQRERINNPTAKTHSWDCRMHLSTTALTAAGALNHKIRTIIQKTNR